MSRQVDYIAEAVHCWGQTAQALEQSAHLWNRLPGNQELVALHRRFLEQQYAIVSDQLEIYDISDADRTRTRY
ncbi:MAG: hypothetical protein JO170_31995 [Verrucomicrobia bacterium]|nr:hypothetical protein [Verrucomicrobiota bacterium]